MFALQCFHCHSVSSLHHGNYDKDQQTKLADSVSDHESTLWIRVAGKILHEQCVASPCYFIREKMNMHINQPTALSTTTQHLITLPAALKAHGQFAIFSQPQCFVSPIFVLLGSHTLPSNRRAMICFSLVWRQLVFFHVLSLSDSYIIYCTSNVAATAWLFYSRKLQVEVDGAFGPWRACGDPFLHHTQFSRLVLLWFLRVII